MKAHVKIGFWLIAFELGLAGLSWAALKLIPPPQQIEMRAGRFDLKQGGGLALVDLSCRLAAEQWREELARQGIRPFAASQAYVYIGTRDKLARELRGQDLQLLADKGSEAYFLLVEPRRIVIAGNSSAGAFYGMQTLKQLVRAYREGATIPCCRIWDWPRLKYRGYSDDISRGPIPTMEFFKRQIRTMAEFKMNMLTFYTEHVFKLQKHPKIAPPEGLTAEEVKELSAYARQYNVELVGNFQSFGHFGNILKHEEYAHLRETPGIITPAKEESYQFLDEVYSEICPAYDSPLFNVNCDETYGLGEGPSKELAAQIGVGGVYVRHMIRLHALLQKYGKRMMMWGDIALLHPEIVQKLPQDTILLSWGYGAAPSYERAIAPFVKAGFEFMVCPGVSCWSRIFPDYDNAFVNIQNYVRDGARLGALGMLNTTWDDDGENLFSWNFYGTNWGAACAWNPEQARREDYDAVFAQLMYGAPDDKITRAIKLLSSCVRNPLTDHNMNRAFWIRPFNALATTREAVVQQAEQLCRTAQEAMELLHAAQPEAKYYVEDLDYLLFAARRLHYIGHSRKLWLQACQLMSEALSAFPDTQPTARALLQAQTTAEEMAHTIAALRTEYERLWRAENRLWWLKEMAGKYEALQRDWAALAQKMAAARAQLLEKGIMPDIESLGLKILETSRRDTCAIPTTEKFLPAKAGWTEPQCRYRLPLKLQVGKQALYDYPVEVAVPFGAVIPAPASLRLVEYTPGRPQSVWPAQLIRYPEGQMTVAFIAWGESPPNSERLFALYFDPEATDLAPLPAPAIAARQEEGVIVVENDRFSLIVGVPGGHIYEWIVKALNNLEITQPGRGGWAGFCDTGEADRGGEWKLELLAAGPVLVRIKATAADGSNEKILSFWAGQPFVEVMLARPVSFYWDYDNINNFAADKPLPGKALFSNGQTAPVCRSDEMKHAIGHNTTWGAKTRADGLLLANLTPEVATQHRVGPGGGWGGVGIEGGLPAAHFITVADKIEGDPAAWLNRLQQTLDLRHQPRLWLGPPEEK